MFNTGSLLTGMKSEVESADSGLESANYSADCNTDKIQQKPACGYGPLMLFTTLTPKQTNNSLLLTYISRGEYILNDT